MFFFFEFTWQDFIDELPFYAEPKNDSEILINLQYAYLAKNDRKAHRDLWLKSIEIAKKLIRNERKQKGFYLDDADFEDKAIEALEYVLRRYSERKDNYCWSVRKNYVSALYNGVRHALYYQSKSEQLYTRLKKLEGRKNDNLHIWENY
ncbi:hypothetical protein DYE50_01290 [Treponema ruminis]|uniref:Uncharacterized protein n=1 Tax=Treponema ruminis TaxID=744515 RepID=A0A7W8GBH5_9SPIR|nr:hypothetical protein [Treponema ruminis]MBB5227407.1 hypothetical protein [Treponema ruminis]QSI01217.1 hypothetical protein DYE50_01290 [Treponema ruminis]